MQTLDYSAEASTGMPSDLCDRCEKLPLSTLLYGPYRSDARHWQHVLGTLQEVCSNFRCSLCNLVTQIIETYYGRQYLKGIVDQCATVNVIFYRTPLDLKHESFGARNETLVPCCLEIGFRSPQNPDVNVHRKDRVSYDEFDRSGVLSAIFSLSAPTGDTKVSIGREVDANNIDWGHVRSWITTCRQDGHFDQTTDPSAPIEQTRSTQPQLRVIDVDAACIVHLPPAAGYAALSYQWGMDQKLKLTVENKERLYIPGYLSSPQGQPSRTIVDAMAATKQLNHRYLWVDALCIVQNSAEDKVLNLSIMDQIYHDADITIVAAAGQNAEHGLPGVSVARTERQMVVNIKGITVSNMLEAAAGAITFSRWNTRGWTYQERLLSPKLLTFTDSQVYYHCDQRCNFHEQFHTESVQPEILDPRAYLDFEDKDIWEMYAIGVAEYSKRSITDPSDRLPAFTGMTSFLERSYGAPFFFGLPVPLFDMGLLWRVAGQCERGESTQPSWSWTGWTGSVMYMAAESMTNMCECTVSQADIYTTPEGTQLCSNRRKEEGFGSAANDHRSWQRSFDTERLRISYRETGTDNAGVEYPRPFTAINASAIAEALESASTTLRILGRTARFRLTDQHSPERQLYNHWKRKCEQGNHTLCHLAILDDQGRWAGTLQVSGELVPRLKDKSHRFLRLSRSTLYRIDEDPSWDDDSHAFRHWTRQNVANLDPCYVDEEPNHDFFDRKEFDARLWWPAINVLLVSGPDKNGVVERLGVGKIHVTAFEAVCEEDEVLLG